jgi:hypothetical protein
VGFIVGFAVGVVGLDDGFLVGINVGLRETGADDGFILGIVDDGLKETEGTSEGSTEGKNVGSAVGSKLGSKVGSTVG